MVFKVSHSAVQESHMYMVMYESTSPAISDMNDDVNSLLHACRLPSGPVQAAGMY